MRFRFQQVQSMLALLLLSGASIVHAGGPRNFPANSIQITITAAAERYIVANDKTQLKLASGVMVTNEQNRSIVRSAIPSGADVKARVLLNGRDEVQHIWLLAADEVLAKPEYKPLTRQREHTAINPSTDN